MLAKSANNSKTSNSLEKAILKDVSKNATTHTIAVCERSKAKPLSILLATSSLDVPVEQILINLALSTVDSRKIAKLFSDIMTTMKILVIKISPTGGIICPCLTSRLINSAPWTGKEPKRLRPGIIQGIVFLNRVVLERN